MARPRPLLWDVMEEHLEEAAFLWTQWEATLTSPRFSRASGASGPEERLRAHLDALVLGGTPVEKKLLAPALVGGEADLAFAAAAALLLGGQDAPVLEAMASAEEPTLGAMTSAVALTAMPTAEPALLRLAMVGAPAAQAAALVALSARGANPGEALRRAAASPDARVQQAAIRSARSAPVEVARPLILQALGSPLATVREAAFEVGLVIGMRQAWDAVRLAAAASPPSAAALLLLALGGGGDELEPLLAAVTRPAPPPAALFAAGFSGRRAAADACATLLASGDARTARLAAEAFSAITGLVLEGPFVADTHPPEPEQPIPFEDEDLDGDLAEGPEALLPEPNAGQIERWWKQHRSSFDADGRCVGGKPVSGAALYQALEHGPLRRRHAHAVEVAVRSGGKLQILGLRWLRAQAVPLEALQKVDVGRPFRELLRGS